MLAAALAALLLAACQQTEPRPNLGLYKDRLTGWYDSGAYAALLEKEVHRADRWLQQVISRRTKRAVVVLDIDETCLSNWAYLQHYGFDVDAGTFRRWVGVHDDPAIAPALALYQRAIAAKIPVFFVTGRREFLRVETERQLRAAGFHGWSGIFFRPVSDENVSVVPFKSGVRRRLEAEGWRVVLNMGDQWSDLEGGSSDRTFKLPNPFYYIP